MSVELEVQMGRRLASRRRALGVNPECLAGAVETDPNQLAKWETGEERVPATALVALAFALSVPVSFFFEGFYWASNRKDQSSSPATSGKL